MENQNGSENLTPPPVQVTSEAKKWYQKRAILAVAILAILAGTLVWAFLMLNKPQDLGPVVVKHKIAATSTADLKDWKTYTNEKYGFEFQYPTYLDRNANIVPPNLLLDVTTRSAFDGLTVAVDSPLDGYDFQQVSSGIECIYHAATKSWTSDNNDDLMYCPKAKKINNQITAFVSGGGDGPILYEDVSVPVEGQNIFIFISLSQSYSDYCDGNKSDNCINPGPYSDEKVFDQIISTFKFIPIPSDTGQAK